MLATAVLIIPMAGCASDEVLPPEQGPTSDVEGDEAVLEAENDRLRKQVSNLQSQLAEKNRSIDSLEQTVVELRQDLSAKNQTIEQLQQRIQELENETQEEDSSQDSSTSGTTSCNRQGEPDRVTHLKTSLETGNYDADAGDEKKLWIFGKTSDDDEEVKFAATVDVRLDHNEGGYSGDDWRKVDEWSFHACPEDFDSYAFQDGVNTLIDDDLIEDGEEYRAFVTVTMDKTGDQFEDSNEFSHYEG